MLIIVRMCNSVLVIAWMLAGLEKLKAKVGVCSVNYNCSYAHDSIEDLWSNWKLSK